MKSPLIDFCTKDFQTDKQEERRIQFWLKILNTYVDDTGFLAQRIARFAKWRVQKIDSEYFRNRIMAICPRMHIAKDSAPPAPDKHYYIFKLLRKNAGRINQELPSTILTMLD